MADALPSIVLLLSCSSEEAEPIVRALCEILSKRFGLMDVSVRSALSPADRWLSSLSSAGEERGLATASSIPAKLFVVLGPPTSCASVLDTDSPYPILSFPNATMTAGGVGVGVTDPNELALSIAKACSLASSALRDRVSRFVFANRQARLVCDTVLRVQQSPRYNAKIAERYDSRRQISGDGVSEKLRSLQPSWPTRKRGKVRDRYEQVAEDGGAANGGNHRLALVTTDRQSGFDRHLAQVPFKGAVLNLTSAYWFHQTSHIIPNHLLSTPHPYVSIVRKCEPFPIEFVVRSYMTGSTSTSIWKNYQDGVRDYCGHILPEGMKKNQKLSENLLTPTTKEEEHDRPISLEEIVAEKWMTKDDLDACADAALRIFALGQTVAADRGLILVDTKYEFGRCLETGKILLVDEVHTPDSSRYWLASSYEERFAAGEEPENIDKEFLRLWFRERCDPYNTEEALPEAPRDLVLELARRYITLYEMITWRDFDFDAVTDENDIAMAVQDGLLR